VNEPTARVGATETEQRSLSVGTVLFGMILVTLGLLWLLDVSGAIDVTWTFVSAVMLILVGGVLIIGAREGSHGGLVFLGLVLSAIVLIGSLATWPSFGGGVGDRETAPTLFSEVESEYRWGMGSERYDFRNVEFPEGDTEIRVSLGMGDLEMIFPDDIGVRVEYQVGAGDVTALEREQSGVGIRGSTQTDGFEESEQRVIIDVQVGLGSVEVRQ
jgi:hypothetical protein